MYRLLAAFIVAVLLSPTAARGDGWPAPAAGLTRTGDPEIIFTFDDGFDTVPGLTRLPR